MPEVRQEVIVTTAVIVSALITYIGLQSYYSWLSKQKTEFKPKKALISKSTNVVQSTTTTKSLSGSNDSTVNAAITSTSEVKFGLNKKMFQEDKQLGGRKIEK